MKNLDKNYVLTFIASHLSADALTKTSFVIIENSLNDSPCDFHVQITECSKVEVLTHHGYGEKFEFTFEEVVNEQHLIRWDSTHKLWYK